MTAHDASCRCWDCVASGKTWCQRTRGCCLKDRHAGDCMGKLRFVWFTLRSLVVDRVTIAKRWRNG